MAALAPAGTRRLLAACSGGPDSMALLDLLHRWGAERGVDVAAAHVDHALRGAASRGDAAFVRRAAESLGRPFRLAEAPVRAWSKKHRRGLEESARILRYRALARLARGTPVATAHTLNDQVETVFLHLIRGTGPAGLAGMPASSAWPVGRGPRLLRPLLNVSRDQIMAYLRMRRLKYRTDATNRLPVFFRNRIRPVLRAWEKDRPGFFRRVAQLAEIQRDEEAHWERRLRREADDFLRRKRAGRFLDLRRLISYDRSEQRRILRRFFGLADFGAIERVRAFALSSKTGVLPVSGGQVHKEAHALVFRKGRGGLSSQGAASGPVRPATVSRTVPVPGEAPVPFSGGLPAVRRIRARRLRRLPAGWRKLGPGRVFADGDKLGSSLKCRFWRPGDRFQPLGMAGRKKLQDFFVDERVSREQRSRVLVVENKRGIVWVVGHRLADGVKLDATTRRVVELSVA